MKLWPIHCRCGAVSIERDAWEPLAPRDRHTAIRRILACPDCPPREPLPW